MSLYTPLFPTSSIPAQPLSASSSLSTVAAPSNYTAYLSQLHLSLASLPAELHPASRSPSPQAEARLATLSKQIKDAVEYAAWETSNSRWLHVRESCRTACTRGYKGRWIGTGRKRTRVEEVEADWRRRDIPETEEEWLRWERTITRERNSKAKAKGKGKMKEVANGNDDVVEVRREKVVNILEKVVKWQANMDETPDAPLIPASLDDSIYSGKSNVEKSASLRRDQSSLGFPVVKRSTQMSKTNKQSRTTYPRSSPMAVSTHSKSAVEAHKDTRDVFDADPEPIGAGDAPLRISDLAEMSFLPPSFPSQLDTSTPIRTKQKPPPIPRQLLPSSALSSPKSTASQPNPASVRDPPPIQFSSQSSPLQQRNSTKRARPLTPSSDDAPMRSSQAMFKTPPGAPPLKKARLTDHAPAPFSSGNPPTTPPRSMSPEKLVTPERSRSSESRLLDVDRAAAPAIPQRERLPTLTELLASARKSKGRTKTPARKLKIATGHVASPGEKRSQNGSPMKVDAQQLSRKTSLASPHLGSSTPDPMDGPAVSVAQPSLSPMKVDQHPLSRTSSLASPALGAWTPDPMDGPAASLAHSSESLRFTQHPSAFAPDFVSTQNPEWAKVGSLGSAGNSAGFSGMGYNSQFDVEGRVDQVDALLNQDVDFDGWLRDVESQHGGSQSQGEVDAGCL